MIIPKISLAEWKYKPKIASKPPQRSHSPTGKPVGRPPSVKTCLEQIRADIDDYTQETLSKYSEEVQRYTSVDSCPFTHRLGPISSNSRLLPSHSQPTKSSRRMLFASTSSFREHKFELHSSTSSLPASLELFGRTALRYAFTTATCQEPPSTAIARLSSISAKLGFLERIVLTLTNSSSVGLAMTLTVHTLLAGIGAATLDRLR